MEKAATSRYLTAREWEVLIEDFQFGGSRRDKWSSQFVPLSALVDLSLSCLLKKDFSYPLKLDLLVFLDEFSESLIISVNHNNSQQSLAGFIETLKLVIQSPVDGTTMTFALKEQMLVSATSVTITLNAARDKDNPIPYVTQMEELVAILVAIVNRPNHGVDRQTRAVACECLRELEGNFPGLLAEIVGHLWALCQSERTHASQSYLLLLLQVMRNIVVHKLGVSSIIGTSVPLIPFNLPNWLTGNSSGAAGEWNNEAVDATVVAELSSTNLKELRRLMAFLLEWTNVFTPCGMAEFMSMVKPLVVALELQASLLKVQFSGLLYTLNPLLSHVALMFYLQFLEAFDGQEIVILKRLVVIAKEGQNHIVFRLLALHWWFGLLKVVLANDERKKEIASGFDAAGWFYPTVFDALSLKSMKLDLLACCSVSLNCGGDETVSSSVKHFEDSLESLSGFKWLPPWSTETAVAFRAIHKFLIGQSSHSTEDSLTAKVLLESDIVGAVKRTLVSLMLNFPKLVPVVISLVERLLKCKRHFFLGENLLLTFDECLLPKLDVNYKMTSYFPLIDRICRTDTISPQCLLDLLTKFMVFLVEQHGPDKELKSWSQGSRVLGCSRTLLMHHHSSRLFIALSHLLAYASLYFPDLEVRDNARIYLRMLVCIPGKKLRETLKLGEQHVGISPSTHGTSAFSVLSPRHSRDPRKSRTVSSYIHLQRTLPLLVKQSWSLSLPPLSTEAAKYGYFGGIKDTVAASKGKDNDNDQDKTEINTESLMIEGAPEMLRVIDSSIAETLEVLRKHFSCIPDFRHMEGLKIKISCELRFKSEPFKLIWGAVDSGNDLSEAHVLPAIYATMLSFSSSAPYGTIPPYHVPFLIGEPGGSNDNDLSTSRGSMEIVPVEDGLAAEKETLEQARSMATVTIELEPREPVPGMVNVVIESNTENGQIIHGPLHSVSVGIEDMFLRAVTPPDISADLLSRYYSDLFDALWDACDSGSSTGREVFSLAGGKGAASIHGTQSVKLLEVPSDFVIREVEECLSPFVVGIIGGPLQEMVRDGGIITDVFWKDTLVDDLSEPVRERDAGPLFLTYFSEGDDTGNDRSGQDTMITGKTYMGCFLVLIFLPPRYHLLFQMEVSNVSTLVRIRTDHWPCLAYIDDYLEALFYQ